MPISDLCWREVRAHLPKVSDDFSDSLACHMVELDAQALDPNEVDHANVAQRMPVCIKHFNDLESAGTEITYRCEKCRICQNVFRGQGSRL